MQPPPGWSPIREKTAPNVTSGEARRTSQESARLSPAPMAAPRTAAMVGIGRSRIFRKLS